MDIISGKKILLITSHKSVIVSGLEKKLMGLGFNVLTVGDSASDIDKNKPGTDLFLYYLPTDIQDDSEIIRKYDFVSIIDKLKDKKLN